MQSEVLRQCTSKNQQGMCIIVASFLSHKPLCVFPCSYATRLVGSQLSPSLATDEQAVLQGALQDLEAQGKAAMKPKQVMGDLTDLAESLIWLVPELGSMNETIESVRAWIMHLHNYN